VLSSDTTPSRVAADDYPARRPARPLNSRSGRRGRGLGRPIVLTTTATAAGHQLSDFFDADGRRAAGNPESRDSRSGPETA
jgi:hypothetical protein